MRSAYPGYQTGLPYDATARRRSRHARVIGTK